jgi:hypothetical protein
MSDWSIQQVMKVGLIFSTFGSAKAVKGRLLSVEQTFVRRFYLDMTELINSYGTEQVSEIKNTCPALFPQ